MWTVQGHLSIQPIPSCPRNASSILGNQQAYQLHMTDQRCAEMGCLPGYQLLYFVSPLIPHTANQCVWKWVIQCECFPRTPSLLKYAQCLSSIMKADWQSVKHKPLPRLKMLVFAMLSVKNPFTRASLRCDEFHPGPCPVSSPALVQIGSVHQFSAVNHIVLPTWEVNG